MQARSVRTTPPMSFAASLKVSDDVKDTYASKIETETEEKEEEFSFFSTNSDESPIAGDGQIQPAYPLFNQDLLFSDSYNGVSASSSSQSHRPPLRKLFFEDGDAPWSSSESDEVETLPEEGSYCEWSKEASPELKNHKSNSTGTSKLWRVKDLVPRSNSDGNDAFVFLKPSASAAAVKTEQSKDAAVKNKGQNGKKTETTSSSAHERHYVMNRAKKEGEKRRSYLPYKPGVVGFFANANVLSKNVHPF